jgi:hypothetical protein
MKISEIRKIAWQRGIVHAGIEKNDLIRAIQRAEGNFDCYGSAVNGYCDQEGCLWREDCLTESAVLKTTG